MPERVCVAIEPTDHPGSEGIHLVEALGGPEAEQVHVRIGNWRHQLTRRERLQANLPGQTPVSQEPIQGAQVQDPDGPETVIALEGRPFEALSSHLEEEEYDLLVLRESGESGRVSSDTERLVRRLRVDTLIYKPLPEDHAEGCILACIDGSPQSYSGLRTALALGRTLNRPVEAIAVYDPYLHYTLFNGIVKVLSEKAAKVFKFADQEKLHEEIIDTGLAKIYQAHLQVAAKVAEQDGVPLKTVLLDGKGTEKILSYVRNRKPLLAVLGRIGIHSQSSDEMDIGATAENVLRAARCHLLLVSSTHVPAVDVQAQASIQWTPEAMSKMERVPSFVKGVATTAILRWAIERGHSVITEKVINTAMGDLLPAGAAQAMGYIAEEVALASDDLEHGQTFLCPQCGYAARDYRPVQCPVCDVEGPQFQAIDREVVESLGSLDKGHLEVEETFDGLKLKWSPEARQVVAQVPKGYERRRSKARIEKTARVRGLQTITRAFAEDVVQQDMADTSYLSDRGERLVVDLEVQKPVDDLAHQVREGSPLTWTDAAWGRLDRVPFGFMRDMTRERVEQFASTEGKKEVNLALCEEGIAEGRKLMAEALANYTLPT